MVVTEKVHFGDLVAKSSNGYIKRVHFKVGVIWTCSKESFAVKELGLHSLAFQWSFFAAAFESSADCIFLVVEM